ncbi:YdcF family protein [Arthrobacter sunyaminii]|uniref:YdcF family protein n=1 Tax=Arthrobacter sunyaminii TaxID=2816859 RepID=A0A975PCP9_9MICC|nr:YdcF family protein [Arthrobacter sunyaminii]MBO0896008.1 YdcF family protein [Arthrobacter sunyaminii]MBO0907683.1 YdcF family protein [Arthrobacter sunyaminii]QWQ35240.1 YdcF family protein [Arthrobacter sunyaminii]
MPSSLRALPHRLVLRLQRGVPRSVDAAVGGVVSVLLIWLFAAANLFFYPQAASADGPVRADAVVVLAGAASERFPVGRELIRDGAAPELVLSSTETPGNVMTDQYCDYMAGDTVTEDPASAAVTCFFPEPMTTRGEARAVARLAADNGWDELIVVTSRYHLLRAETNISQCTTAKVTMVASEPDLSAKQWLDRFVEETGGLAAALLRPACASAI